MTTLPAVMVAKGTIPVRIVNEIEDPDWIKYVPTGDEYLYFHFEKQHQLVGVQTNFHVKA